MLLRLDHVGARDGYCEYSQHIAGVAFKRNRGGIHTVLALAGEIQDSAGRLTAHARGVDQRLIAVRTGHLAGGGDQQFRIECGWRRRGGGRHGIAVKANLHSRRNGQIGEKALVESLAGDQPEFRLCA